MDSADLTLSKGGILSFQLDLGYEGVVELSDVADFLLTFIQQLVLLLHVLPHILNLYLMLHPFPLDVSGQLFVSQPQPQILLLIVVLCPLKSMVTSPFPVPPLMIALLFSLPLAALILGDGCAMRLFITGWIGLC